MGIVIHRIRNPLAGISAAVEILKMKLETIRQMKNSLR